MRTTAKYIVLCGQIVGNMSAGYATVYSFDGDRFDTREEAISHGFRVLGSDDFNIGVLKGAELVSLDWMSETVDTDRDVLKKIQEEIYV